MGIQGRGSPAPGARPYGHGCFGERARASTGGTPVPLALTSPQTPPTTPIRVGATVAPASSR